MYKIALMRKLGCVADIFMTSRWRDFQSIPFHQILSLYGHEHGSIPVNDCLLSRGQGHVGGSVSVSGKFPPSLAPHDNLAASGIAKKGNRSKALNARHRRYKHRELVDKLITE